jgi:hypothetical protein
MFEEFLRFFTRHGIIAIPEINNMPRDFMEMLDNSNKTYTVLYQPLAEYNFYIFRKDF